MDPLDGSQSQKDKIHAPSRFQMQLQLAVTLQQLLVERIIQGQIDHSLWKHGNGGGHNGDCTERAQAIQELKNTHSMTGADSKYRHMAGTTYTLPQF